VQEIAYMAQSAAARSIVLLITREGMGEAPPDLQRRLLGTYLSLLVDSEMLPGAICFYTDGVKLACEGSPVLPQLQALEAKGVHLVLCQTCRATSGWPTRCASAWWVG
jgi:hypothetical protein